MNVLCLRKEQETIGHEVKPVLNLFHCWKIGSTVYRESFLHRRESRPKPFNFKTIESSFHYASAELFFRKINSIKVSFGRGALVLTFTRISISQLLWVGEKTREQKFWWFFCLPRGALILVVSPHGNPVRPPPPSLFPDPISSELMGPLINQVTESLAKESG